MPAVLTLDPASALAPVRRRLFGSFVEQMGRGVYGGIFEPQHPAADANGFRRDVIEMVRQLGISTVRYPGGNFVSGYRWEDGVGPLDQRPSRLDLAWHAVEPNIFGLDEFIAWCRIAEVEPMMAINLGTRGAQEAVDLLEYCNVVGGTSLSDRRRENGSLQPHDIRIWCLGNEMDGPWQIGQKSPQEYGALARTTARAMRAVDPDLELVVCGSSGSDMPQFAEWERVVLHETYDEVDYISAHAYYFEQDGDLGSFLASGAHMERYIEDVISTADHVRAARKSIKRINISFDEWNVWYQTPGAAATKEWSVGEARIEDHYTSADAVVVGSMLIALLKHADRVHAASLAQLVNVIAPIMSDPATGDAWKQTTFHPFELVSSRASGVVLNASISSPSHETLKHGEVGTVDAVATWNAESETLDVFAVNRSANDAIPFTISARGFDLGRITSVDVVGGEDPHFRASAATPLKPKTIDIRFEDGQAHLVLPPASWTAIRLN